MPARQQVLQTAPGKRGAVIAFSGDTNAIFDRGNAGQLVPNRDGLSAFATTVRTVAPVRVVRSTGEPLNVTAGRGYDWPYAWSADGKRVAYSLGVDGTNRRALRLRPTNLALGATARPRNIAFTPDLRYAAFLVDSVNRPDAFAFVVVDLQTGVARPITSRSDRTGVSTGSGNWYATNHGEFIYTERNGGQLDVRAAKPSGGNAPRPIDTGRCTTDRHRRG
jgi:hypothetical protein